MDPQPINARDAQLQFLARTLMVGMPSGALLGASSAAVLVIPYWWAAVVWIPGALVGLVLGAVTSLVGAVLVLTVRRQRWARPILAAVTALFAGVTVSWLTSWFDAAWLYLAAPIALALIITGAFAWFVAPWCLAPLSAPLPQVAAEA